MWTEVSEKMLRDKADSTDKCRERRRRRIVMRRMSSVPTSSSAPLPSETENSVCAEEAKPLCTSASDDLLLVASSVDKEPETVKMKAKSAVEEGPVFGAVSVAGRSREMEDAISIWTHLCRPEINQKRPVHFFAVYDGHGGAHVAASCKKWMHVFVEEELMSVICTGGKEREGSSSLGAEENVESWKRAMKRSFERMDEVAMNTCVCGSVGFRCGCRLIDAALGGSTAVVALLTDEYIIVSNCGNSRAVLCRAGKTIPLSFDHKPDRSDELARIEAAGGQVLYYNGARVQGILAMSRAIGDGYLKPAVTWEPEITFTKRELDDDFLILASDGLWDVLSSELACGVTLDCLREGSNVAATAFDLNARPRVVHKGAETLYPSRSSMAAALLTRLALGRRSYDNISVIVIDLKSSSSQEELK
ncbi:hypothetical protein SLE2022_371540 [Rubroshorea leprosula]